jgi:glycosyltransferase involved in cell wall biosynthesis
VQILIVASKGSGGSFKAASRMADAYRALEGTTVEFVALEDELPQGFVNRIVYRISNVLTAKLSSFFESPVSLDCLLHYLDLPNFGDFDIVHLHWINRRGVSLKKLDLGGAKVFWTLHDSWSLNGFFHLPAVQSQNVLKKSFGRLIVSFSKRKLSSFVERHKMTFLAPSNFMATECASAWPNVNVIEIPNFIGEYFLEDDTSIIEKTQSLLFVAESPTANGYKGYLDIISLAKLLDDKQSNLVIKVVGSIDASDQVKDLPNLKFVGRIDSEYEMRKLYCESIATLVLSKIENAPYVALESICSGTPVVGYDVGGMAEIISTGVGVLLPYGKIDGVLRTLFDLTELISLKNLENKRGDLLRRQKNLVHEYTKLYLCDK